MNTQWKPIESAPRDGTVFIARNADHPKWGSWPMLRNVRHVYQDGSWACLDLGGWLEVLSIEPDYEGGISPVGLSVPFAIAADELNRTVRYEWMPLPRDSDGTAPAAACGDMPVPKDCQARAEGIAQDIARKPAP